MGQVLFREYLEKHGEDILEILLMGGVETLLNSFETWLVDEGYLAYKNGSYSKLKELLS